MNPHTFATNFTGELIFTLPLKKCVLTKCNLPDRLVPTLEENLDNVPK